MTRGMRWLVGGIAALGFVLVLTGHLLGAEWARMVLGLIGATT